MTELSRETVDLSAGRRLVLAAALDRVIPEDNYPSATGAGVMDFIEGTAGSFWATWPLLLSGLDDLEAEAKSYNGGGFALLPPDQQDQVLASLEHGEVRTTWQVDPAEFFSALVTIAADGFYADPGTGAGGGTAAYVLALAGLEVLVVERGDALRTDQVPADHLRNHRLARLGHNTGPSLSGNPRVLVSDEGPQVLTPVDPGWNNNAMTLGGGTRVWGAQAWRMSPTDFRMATSAVGLFDEPVTDGAGPGPAIATCRFLHGNEGLVGGGMLADEFVKTPTSFWHTALPPGVPRWGMAGKVAMRDGYRRTAHVMGPIQELPNGAARVQLDHTVADHLGLPVARLSGNSHPDDYRTARFLADRALEWMEASGAAKVWSWPSPKLQPRLSAGQHQAGTCRIGTDPATSVCDPTGTLHDCPNVVLADGSVHVTNGGVNPTLTIMALAWRSAEALASRL